METLFLTFTCYGQHQHGHPDGSWNRDSTSHAPHKGLERYEQKLMSEPAYALDPASRALVLAAIEETALRLGWNLIAVHVRTTHVHLVVEAERTPDRVLATCKAYATRALRHAGQNRERFWVRRLRTRVALDDVVRYVLDGQGEQMVCFCSIRSALMWPDRSDG